MIEFLYDKYMLYIFYFFGVLFLIKQPQLLCGMYQIFLLGDENTERDNQKKSD